jgi:hypothetical protein
MMPKIAEYAKSAFCGFAADAERDVLHEVVANAFFVFARLTELGKDELAYASVLARYGVARFRYDQRHECYSRRQPTKKGFNQGERA